MVSLPYFLVWQERYLTIKGRYTFLLESPVPKGVPVRLARLGKVGALIVMVTQPVARL